MLDGRRALDAVAKLDGVKLVATVPRDKARGLPTFIENRGLLDAAGYASLLGEAQVALGLGDPVLGPGALDALEHGCAVVQVKYPKPRVERWVGSGAVKDEHGVWRAACGTPGCPKTLWHAGPCAAILPPKSGHVRSRKPSAKVVAQALG